MGDSYDPGGDLTASVAKLREVLLSAAGDGPVQVVARAALHRHLSVLLQAISTSCETGSPVVVLVKLYPPAAGLHQNALLGALLGIADLGGVIARVRDPAAMTPEDTIGTYELMYGDVAGQWADE